MTRRIAATCTCCGLKFLAADRSDMYSVTGDIGTGSRKAPALHCQDCRYHQGSAPEQELKRHQDHEPKLRHALEAAAAYAVKAEKQVAESRERVSSALHSRDRAIAKLSQVQDLHTLKPDGACTCGIKKDCRTAAALYERWLQSQLQRGPRNDY